MAATMREITGPNGHLANMRPFKGNSLMAKASAIVITFGRLPDYPHDYRSELRALESDNRLSYIVYSYDTPIAWVDVDGNVTIPNAKYSVTTSKHQSACHAWLKA